MQETANVHDAMSSHSYNLIQQCIYFMEHASKEACWSYDSAGL